MELELLREYFPKGTNGELWHDGKLICKTIELPWKENAKRISCIPEGRYSLIIKWHKKHGWVILLHEVPERKGILMHPANKALIELKGCIAPVLNITGAGTGTKSKAALKLVLDLLQEALPEEENFITIKTKSYEHITTHTSPDSKVL